MSQENPLLPFYSTSNSAPLGGYHSSIDSSTLKNIFEPLLNGLHTGASICIALSSLGDSLIVINSGLTATIVLSLYSAFNQYNSYKEKSLRYQLAKANYANLSSTEMETVLVRLLQPFGLRAPPQLDHSNSVDFIMSLTYPTFGINNLFHEISVTGIAAFLGLFVPVLPYFFATPLISSTISGFLTLFLIILIHYVDAVYILKLSSEKLILLKIIRSILSNICIMTLGYFALNCVTLVYNANLQ